MQSLNTNLMKQLIESGRRNNFFFQYFVIFVFIFFSILQYSIQKIYGLAIYPDEFGYWACAAKWIGYDWSECASLGSYYSFGYSVILCPVLFFCKNGIAAYRVAVFVNMTLQCISILLLWGIFRRILYWLNPDGKNKVSNKIAGRYVLIAISVSMFYPVWTFYMQMTLTEALLTFMYVFICYLFVIFLEKPKLISAILLVLSLLYLYFVHMRTIGVVIAAILTLFVYVWQKPDIRKLLVICLITLILGAGIGLLIKENITSFVYTTADTALLSVNDYAGQIGKIKQLFSLDGAIQLLTSCIGKIYYMGMATFGFFYVAIGYLIKETWKLICCCMKKENKERPIGNIQWVSLFLLLSACGQLFISAVFTMNPGRLDGIVYGRYNDFMMPAFIGIGILILMREDHPVRVVLVNIGILLSFFGISLYAALKSGQTIMQGYFAAGISYLSNEREYQIVPEFCKAFVFGIFLMLIMTICIQMGKRMERSSIVVATVLIIEIILTFCLTEKYIYAFNETNYEKLRIYEYMEEYQMKQDATDETGSISVSYLYNGGQTYIDLIQFMMQEESLHVIREQNDLPKHGFLIVDKNSNYLEKMEEQYKKCLESNDFVLFLGEETK